MDSPEVRVKIAAAEAERLKDYLGNLPPDAWNRPSACGRWEVRDVVAHLAFVAEAYVQRIHESLAIDLSSWDEETAPGPISAVAHANGSAETAISRRQSLGDGVLADFIEKNDELMEMMFNLSGEDWDRPHYYSSIGTVPMRYRPDLWISELAAHGWDIRSRLEPEVHLSDETLPTLLDVAVGQMTIFFFKPRPKLSSPIRFRWELTGAGARNVDIVVDGETISVQDVEDVPADVTFRCNTETYFLVVEGRISVEDALSDGRLTFQGKEALVPEFENSFAWS